MPEKSEESTSWREDLRPASFRGVPFLVDESHVVIGRRVVLHEYPLRDKPYAEDLGKNREYREQFDFCVSRAVANLSTLSEYCIPFVKTGGFFIPYKSGKSQEEISEAEGAVLHLGGKMEGTVFETLPNSEAERAFVLIKKVSATPKKYPRKAGTPSRDPIS